MEPGQEEWDRWNWDRRNGIDGEEAVGDGTGGRREMVRERNWTGEGGLRAGYTVEAAGVMALVLITIMILINQALRIHGATVGAFSLHDELEQKRHAIDQIGEGSVTMETQGRDWSLEITAPVFRPEELLRMWSLTEEPE